MNPKLLGYGVISVGVLVFIVVFTTAYGYRPDADLLWNLSNAKTLRLTETTETECPRPGERLPEESALDYLGRWEAQMAAPAACPRTLSGWVRNPSITRTTEVFSLPLGAGVGGSIALVLVGAGLMWFGGSRQG